MLSRRTFLALCGASFASARELACDVAVIGGGLGGVAAALAALRNGMRVVLTEETDWIGGQMTSQLTPPDEHPYIESFGSTRLYRELRSRIRDYYRRNYPLTQDARENPLLSPGGGTVNRLTFEPRVALAVLEEMLQPWVSQGKLVVLLDHRPVAAEASDVVRAVTVRDRAGGNRVVQAKYFLDATEQGDLLPLTRTEFVTGFESRNVTGEPHAPAEAQPENLQANTVCFAFDYRPGEDHTIEKPNRYAFWRDYVPKLKPAWPGKLFSLTYSNPKTLGPRTLGFDPTSVGNFWTYRRVLAKDRFLPGAVESDISTVNWPQNDYLLSNFLEKSNEAMNGASELSLCWMYWLQTEAPRPDGGQGWRGLRLRPDVTGTSTGLAKAPYIRESRRIAAEFTICEQHIATDARGGSARAEHFNDSVGVGTYRIDLHPSTGGDNYIDISSLPFQIPLGAMIPKRVRNLIPACKNIGTTHITNGCYRLHPVEWNIGESAGELAAHAVLTSKLPRQVRREPDLLEAFQRKLGARGIEISWPQLTPR